MRNRLYIIVGCLLFAFINPASAEERSIDACVGLLDSINTALDIPDLDNFKSGIDVFKQKIISKGIMDESSYDLGFGLGASEASAMINAEMWDELRAARAECDAVIARYMPLVQ
jgi:hypothetical protein